MKKTKRIIKKQTKKRINKKQTKKRINKKQTKKRNKKTFYMQRGGPKKRKDIPEKPLPQNKKVSGAQEVIDPHVQEDIDNLLASAPPSIARAPPSSLEPRSAAVPRWQTFISNTKSNAGNLIVMIDSFFTSCGIKKEYYIIGDTRTFFLYFMVRTKKIYFLYTTFSISEFNKEEVLEKIENENRYIQERYKALFDETPEYAQYTLHVLFQMCVLNGFAFTTIAESYLMAQFFLRDNIVFAEKEDTTDQSAMVKNFNHFLGYFSYDPGALEFKQASYVIPDMAASASAAESQEDQLSSQDSSSTYGSTQAKASQMAYASQDERDEADDDFDPEDELMVIPTDSKRALVPETLAYLVTNLPEKIHNAQSKWNTNERKILQHYTEEAIALTQKSDFWKFEGPQQYHDSEVSQDEFFAPPDIDI